MAADPFDLKVSTRPHLPQDVLGAMLCHAGGSQKLQSNQKGKPHVVTFLRMSLSMSVPPITAFRSARLVQTRGAGGCVYFYPVLLDSPILVCFNLDDNIPVHFMNT